MCTNNQPANSEVSAKNRWHINIGGALSHLSPRGTAWGWGVDDRTSRGYILSGGWYYHENFSIDASYLYAGKAGLANENTNIENLFPDSSIDYKMYSLWGTYYLLNHQKRLNLFFKAGVSKISNTASHEVIPFTKQSSTQFAIGTGVAWRINKNDYIRFELNSYDKDAQAFTFQIGRLF